MTPSISVISTALIAIISTVNAGYPITEPNSGTHGRSAQITRVPYNMIDAYPSCYARGLCPMFQPGGELSAFPNSEEKAQQLLHNMFRMFPNESLVIKWGKWRLAANKNLGRTFYCPSCEFCGTTHLDRKPLYWYSDANQAARFKQYDENSCDQSWYDEPGVTAHHTCKWVLPEYGGGSNCDLFGSCAASWRMGAFCVEDDCWFETEGICGANTCYVDPHCEPIFGNHYDYSGAGFVEGMNGASAVYSRYTDEIFYRLHSGAHLDERLRIVSEDRDVNGKYFVLMAMYFDANNTDHLDKCWALYDGAYHEMDVELSDHPDTTNGYLADSHNVMLSSRHNPPIDTCEPYAFICKSQSGKLIRLPEDKRYYFGTEWLDWEWSNHNANWNLKCRENHYFNNGQQWIVNGDPKLDKCDIWYYQDNVTYSECIGCPSIPKLDCWQDCIYSNFDAATCSTCDSIIGQSYGNEYCAPGWTYSPTVQPTKGPSRPPVTDPTNSANPTMSPSNDPSNLPSSAPTTDSPTISPSEFPSTSPTTAVPSLSPTMRPSKSPLRPGETSHPTSYPTHEPTDQPTSGPTFLPSVPPSIPITSTTLSMSSNPSTSSPTPSDKEKTASPTISPSQAVVAPQDEEKESDFLGTTMGIVAIAGGGAVLCICVLLMLWCCLRRKRQQTKTVDDATFHGTTQASIVNETVQRQSIVKHESFESENQKEVETVDVDKEQSDPVVTSHQIETVDEDIVKDYQQSLKTTNGNATNIIATNEDEAYEYHYDDGNGEYEYYYEDKDGGGDEEYEYYEE